MTNSIIEQNLYSDNLEASLLENFLQSKSSVAIIRQASAFLGGTQETLVQSRRVLAFICQKASYFSILEPSFLPDIVQLKTFVSYLIRLKKAEPEAYILGQEYFCGHVISVGEGVLIPRPDSETLVNVVWKYLELMLHNRSRHISLLAEDELNETKEVYQWNVLEPFVGSACLTKSILALWQEKIHNKELSDNLHITATDISSKALGYAKVNLKSEVEKAMVILEEADIWPNNTEMSFDLLMANPPYISDTEYLSLDKSVLDYEPKLALVAKEEGLYFYRRLLEEATSRLRKNAYIIVEHGYNQADKLKALVKSYKDYEYIEMIVDLANRPRVSVIKKLV